MFPSKSSNPESSEPTVFINPQNVQRRYDPIFFSYHGILPFFGVSDPAAVKLEGTMRQTR
jgi:hypothetical protein